ncbi:replication-relaxation family protein [Pseudofrankia sp. BMG5.36]|uniref:replication-relaxation family protein n=1 Tax=Pseudofrankia sp. BMG5.36 TaxID=1834512 RepID=UPI0008D8D69B|nr:replication-relaxation family protein [Pseudofrankia sp. BMG5.36]OHV61392.1 hypothetical protein BCD48_39695 [Pseudofrankia sp. BMG5.36]
MSGQRVSAGQVERLAGLLSERDWRIVIDLQRVKVLTGQQLDQLHFQDVATSARGRVRRRTMARLRDWRVVAALERRIGGERAGSSGLIFTLDTAGRRLLERHQAAPDEPAPATRIRRPRTPRPLFLAHALAVSQLYVDLAAAVKAVRGLTLDAFATEPACWWPDGGGWLKPDAYLALASTEFVDHVWAEVDRATESLPTLRGKLHTYLDFLNRGELGPGGVMPRVVISVPDDARAAAIRREVARLPDTGVELFSVVRHEVTAQAIVGGLLDGGAP